MNLKKGLCGALHPDMLFLTKNFFLYIERAWTEKSWKQNELFFTLVRFISRSNDVVSS